MRIHDDKGQFGGDGQADRFHFQRDAGTRAGRNAQRSGIGSADRRAHGGDLVFRLERDHAEFLHRGELVQQGRCRRDRIGAEGEADVGQTGAGEQTQRD